MESEPPAREPADVASPPGNVSGGSPARANPSPGFLTSLRLKTVPWLRANGADIVAVSALVGLCIVVRVLTLDEVGTGGDAITKWHFARQWFYKNDFSHGLWDQHMARLGVTSIVYITQRLLGRGPNVWYVAPVAAAVLETIFVYAVGKRLGGRFAGVAAALLLTFFPAQVGASSQVMPEIFSGAYSIVATYLYLRYASAAGRARWQWLAATSVAMFVAYLGKETSFFFYPGFVIAIWKTERRYKEVALFCGILLLGLACETACYRLFTEYSSRAAAILGTHVPIESKDTVTFSQLFDRYGDKLQGSWRFVFYTFLSAFLGVLAFFPTAGARAVLWIVASYYFLLTFLVRSINPLMIWQSFRTRYLDPTAPFVAVVIALFLTACLREGLKRDPYGWWARTTGRAQHVWMPLVVAVSAVLGLTMYLSARPKLDESVLKLNTEIAAIANDTYRRNLPFVSNKDPRGVWTVYAVFIDDKLLARKGVLPTYADVKQNTGSREYLVRNPSDYDEQTLRRLMNKHCYIEVSRHHGEFGISLKPMHKLDGACDEELARDRGP